MDSFENINFIFRIIAYVMLCCSLVFTVFYVRDRYQRRKEFISRQQIFLANFHCLLELGGLQQVYMSKAGLYAISNLYPERLNETIRQVKTKVTLYVHYCYWSNNRKRDENICIIIDPQLEGLIYDTEPVDIVINSVEDLYH